MAMIEVGNGKPAEPTGTSAEMAKRSSVAKAALVAVLDLEVWGDTYKREAKELRESLKTAVERLDHVEAQNADLRTERDQANARAATETFARQDAVGQLEESNRTVKAQAQVIQELEAELARERGEHNATRDKLAHLEMQTGERIGHLEADLGNARRRAEDLGTQLAAARADAKDARQHMKNQANVIEQYRQIERALNGRIDSLDRQVANYSEAIDSANATIRDLEARLATLQPQPQPQPPRLRAIMGRLCGSWFGPRD